MPRHTPIQHSFNGGEFSPRMLGRTDLEKYRAAARLIQNFNIIPQGGLVRRSGTRYVADAALEGSASRLHAFIFSDVQAYILEFSDRRLRMFVDEGLLLHQALTPINASEDVSTLTNQVTYVGHGYRNGDGPLLFTSTGTVPTGILATESYYIKLAKTVTFVAADVEKWNPDAIVIRDHDLQTDMGPYRFQSSGTIPPGLLYDTDYYILYYSADEIKLQANPGAGAITITGPGSGTHLLVPTPTYMRDKFRLSAGEGLPAVQIAAPGTGIHTITPQNPQPVVLTTPYAASELGALQFAQSADVLYIAHRNHAPRALSRFSIQGFSLDAIDFIDGPYLDENTDDTHTFLPAATTGQNILLTSSKAIFKSTDVGRLVRILDDDTTNDPAWGYAKIVSVNPNEFGDADIYAEAMATTDAGADEIVTAAHGMNTGDHVRIFEDPGGTVPDGLTNLTNYYVRRVSSTRLAFFLTKQNAIDDASRIALGPAVHIGTVFITSAVININDHGFIGEEGPVTLTNEGGLLPTGYTADTEYFIGFVDENNITLSTSRGGVPFPADRANGGGLHTLQGSTAPSTTCQIDIKRDFQRNAAVPEWRLGSWSGESGIGFPRAVTFHEQRLWWAGSVKEPQKLWSSRTAQFTDYAPTGNGADDISAAGDGSVLAYSSAVHANNGITHEIGAAQVNVIQWLVGGRTLILGAANASWSAGASVASEGVTPTNFQVRQAGSHGSAPIVPVIVDDRVIYISDTLQKTFSLGYSFQSDNYLAEDMTLLADHISMGDLTALAYSHEPNSTVWFVRGDGKLAALTLIRDQKIAGWTRHVLGGTGVVVESVAVIPSPVGDASSVGRVNRNHDQVWISVKRTVGGSTKRWVEFIEDVYESSDTLEDAFFLDGASTYNAAPTATPGPFTHLAGETVDVLADGRQHLALTVSAAGVITLPEAASIVHAGYTSIAQLQSLRIALQDQMGDSQSNLGRIDHLVLRVDNSMAGEYGPSFLDLTQLDRLLIPADQLMDTVPPVYSGDIEIEFDGGWDAIGEIFIQCNEPLPFSVLAVLARLQRSSRGDRARSGA